MAGDFGAASIKMVGSLMLILGLIIGLFYLLKRFRLNAFSMGKNPMMRHIGTLSLAPKRSLALVEICGQWLVVGIGADNITLISRVDAPSETGQFENHPDAGRHAFHTLLREKAHGILRGRGKNGKS
ncbi:MAG: flagellar biosynthetic protein FliO [Pseudomonadota bacterium]